MPEHMSHASKAVENKSHKQSSAQNAPPQPFTEFQPEALDSGILTTPEHVMTLQRTIGNRATIQLLRQPMMPESFSALLDMDTAESADGVETETQVAHSPVDASRSIQRVPLPTSQAMLAIAPFTTNIFGKKKASAYNHLVDAVKRYWTYVGMTKRTGDNLQNSVQQIVTFSNMWWGKHADSTKAKDVAKKPIINQVRDTALAMRDALITANRTLDTATGSIELLYNSDLLWDMVTEWARDTWVLDENTNFYASVQEFTTVQQGKDIIAQHLLDRAAGDAPMSPQLFNVSGPLFERARALYLQPNGGLTVDDFRPLFTKAISEAMQVWNDLKGKARNDVSQGGRDSFVFSYLVRSSPTIITGGV